MTGVPRTSDSAPTRASASAMRRSAPQCSTSTRLASSPEPLWTTLRIDRSSSAKTDAEPVGTVRLVGKHCESGDVLVGEAALPPVGPGDLVCLPATGAYGVSMASNYNGVTRPAVVFVDGGRARLVTRRETYDDLLARDV
jgi:diaminopimelate decarboxylase